MARCSIQHDVIQVELGYERGKFEWRSLRSTTRIRCSLTFIDSGVLGSLEPDEGHFLLDVQLVDGVLELFEVNEAVVVFVGLRDDPVDDQRYLLLSGTFDRKSVIQRHVVLTKINGSISRNTWCLANRALKIGLPNKSTHQLTKMADTKRNV